MASNRTHVIPGDSRENMTKDPNARLDFKIDWSAWLSSGDSITSSQWFIPDDLADDTPSISGAITTVWLSGGVDGRTYQVTNRVTTAQGRVDDRTIRIAVTSQ